MPVSFAARSSAFAIATLLAAVRAGAAEATPREVTPAASDAALQELFKGAVATAAPDPRTDKARDWQLGLTTWLPGEWPPTPKTMWKRYAYGLDVTLDGVSGVSVPFARLERPPGEAKSWTLIPMAQKLAIIGQHPVRPVGGWHYTKEDERRALAYAFTLTGAPPAGARESLELAAYFKSWRLASAEIATHIAPQHRAFFAWLEKQ